MKRALYLAILVLCGVSPARPDSPALSERLAGDYFWSVHGSVWTLSLRTSGDYTLTTRVGFEREARPIESGRWLYEGFTLILKSDQKPVGGIDYRHLYVLRKKSGRLMLVSALRRESYRGEPFGKDILFDYVFLRADESENDSPNQAREATATAGMSAVGQPPRQP